MKKPKAALVRERKTTECFSRPFGLRTGAGCTPAMQVQTGVSDVVIAGPGMSNGKTCLALAQVLLSSNATIVLDAALLRSLEAFEIEQLCRAQQRLRLLDNAAGLLPQLFRAWRRNQATAGANLTWLRDKVVDPGHDDYYDHQLPYRDMADSPFWNG